MNPRKKLDDPMADARRFGEWVRAERKARLRASVETMSRAAGFNRDTWVDVERGGRLYSGELRPRRFSDATYYGIAEALGVPAREVFERAGVPIPPEAGTNHVRPSDPAGEEILATLKAVMSELSELRAEMQTLRGSQPDAAPARRGPRQPRT